MTQHFNKKKTTKKQKKKKKKMREERKEKCKIETKDFLTKNITLKETKRYCIFIS